MSVQKMQFEITRVNGISDYRIPVVNGRLVLVGTNGSGKTTICKIIQLFLSGHWYYLAKMSFSSVRLTVYDSESTETYLFDLDGLKKVMSEKDEQIIDSAAAFFVDRPVRIVDPEEDGPHLRFLRSLEKGKSSEGFAPLYFQMGGGELAPYYPDTFDQPEDAFLNNLRRDRNLVVQRFGRKILYLPTYRRIEAELNSLLLEDERDRRSRRMNLERDMYFENGIIHFGMADVERAITEKVEHLKSFSLQKQIALTQGYLHDVLAREYQNVDEERLRDLDPNLVLAVLGRIEASLLSNDEKTQIVSIVLGAGSQDWGDRDSIENRKIIMHYFTRLQGFYEELQQEEKQVKEFCDMCNKYLYYNEIVYDERSYRCYVESIGGIRGRADRDAREISLESLSSGEKQIVGLFSKLILEDDDNILVIIDEPEISISMEWQRTILIDVLNSRNCGCLIAATHSPFVFDNELVSSTHNLDEFLVG